MTEPRLKYLGWGNDDTYLTQEEEKHLLNFYANLGGGEFKRLPVPSIADIALHLPRIQPSPKISSFCSSESYDRLLHTYGKSLPDYVRGFNRDYSNAPDVVAYPSNERDIVEVLDWAQDNNIAVIPFGGGSSVVGGVEAAIDGQFNGTISLNLTGLNRILEIDKTSRAARIEAGIFGPSLEAQLKPEGLTLRHFPQSFEFSTLGGWIATRSGGHYASLYTHIDDFVESLKTITPSGILESRRLPGSGAGPSPDRLIIGSEGSLGIITEAWMRLQERPTYRASVAIRFEDFYAGADAVRAVSQSGLYPSNARLLDPNEARITGAGDGNHALVILAFESADHPVEPWMDRALQICTDHGGVFDSEAAGKPDAQRSGAAGAWRNAFIRMPYFRELLAAVAVINFTFETSITWDRFRGFHDTVKEATEEAIQEATALPGLVTCRFTHIYPDGPAPYFTIHARSRHGAVLDQWKHIKYAASDAVIEQGGTITHHHAVGRDHMPWYERQRPALFGDALAGAKSRLDPSGILNPGVL